MTCCEQKKDHQAFDSYFLNCSVLTRCVIALTIALLWGGVYLNVQAWADVLVYDVMDLARDSAIGKSLAFFIYDTTKILLLLVMMIYLLAWLRAGLNVQRVRNTLTRLSRFSGYIVGSIFGAVTPFCSCSSIPLFLGFTSAGIPLGVTLAFLITSPIINEVALVILYGLLGPKLTIAYVIVGLGAGILGGVMMDALKADRWLADFLKQSIHHNLVIDATASSQKLTFADRHLFATKETRDIFRRVAKWVVIGVGVGAAIHGFLPENWVSAHLGAGQWWTVPSAVVMGLPLYTNVTGVIPVMESLLLKGLPVGTTFAFAMASIAGSLPEFLMLRQVMKPQLLALFFGYLIVVFTLVGYLMNALQIYLI